MQSKQTVPSRLLDVVGQVAAKVLAKFPSIVSTTTMPVLHMIHAAEHTGAVVVDVLEELASSHSDSGLLTEILREMSHVGGEESKDSAGVRNVADFLVRECCGRLSALSRRPACSTCTQPL